MITHGRGFFLVGEFQRLTGEVLFLVGEVQRLTGEVLLLIGEIERLVDEVLFLVDEFPRLIDEILRLMVEKKLIEREHFYSQHIFGKLRRRLFLLPFERFRPRQNRFR